jgi:hypothetical protein
MAGLNLGTTVGTPVLPLWGIPFGPSDDRITVLSGRFKIGMFTRLNSRGILLTGAYRFLPY